MAGCLLIFAAAACSNPPGAVATGPTVSSVSVQQSDLPNGMVRCPISGKIEDFIKAEQTPDPNSAKSISGYWTDAQSNGAKAAYAAIYTDSHPGLALLLDVEYGSATFAAVAQPAELELRVSTTGLLLREASSSAR